MLKTNDPSRLAWRMRRVGYGSCSAPGKGNWGLCLGGQLESPLRRIGGGALMVWTEVM
jgi:hypothetical protein